MKGEVCNVCFKNDCNVCEKFPWFVNAEPGRGNVMVASRDIRPKEIILQDTPLGLGPLQSSQPICLQCFKLVETEPSTRFECVCGFPMCSQVCSKGDRHKVECEIYQSAGARVSSLLEYQIIMPIRMLSMMDKDPVAKARFCGMLDHRAEREMETDNWEFINKNVVKPIREKLNKMEWSPEIIHRCVGVTRTNGSCILANGIKDPVTGNSYQDNKLRETVAGVVCDEDSLEDDQVGMVRMLYMSMAYMNHSCIPNCNTSHNPDYSLTVRTMKHVKKGEELTISYAKFFTGRLDRQEDFNSNWFFDCKCIRCQDVSDLGSNFDTHICSRCGSNLLPTETSKDSPWNCENCQEKVEAQAIGAIEKSLRSRLLEPEYKKTIQFYEDFIKENEQRIHKGHNIMMLAKVKLLMSYENPLERKTIQRKIELCQDVLRLLNIILPGLTEIRGRILYEISAPTFLLLQMDLKENKINMETFVIQLKLLSIEVEECLDCMEGEIKGSFGFYIHEKAGRVLTVIKDMIHFSDYLAE